MSNLISAAGLPESAGGRALPAWLVDFYRAYFARDPDLLDAILDDDIDWLLAGPAEQIDFFGHRRGKAEVIEVITRVMPCYIYFSDFEIEHLLVQGDRAALYGHLRARQRDTGRWIRYRGVHFLHVRDGKIVSYRGIADTFDAAEQLVGHPIDVNRRIERVALAPEVEELVSL